jgi:hypothetical protein
MNITKSKYSAPEIKCIELDNEISLILQSDPPYGPNEVVKVSPEFFNKNPFHANLV